LPLPLVELEFCWEAWLSRLPLDSCEANEADVTGAFVARRTVGGTVDSCVFLSSTLAELADCWLSSPLLADVESVGWC